ncbi:hypothetical protein [Streptomyces sp. NBC_00887]|nr:hypothetical protein OG844_04650 [Streptomyces sp. NBC_00887]WSY35626.1 hypothetical protein OG844_40950 [Streptomyces sp. NBC_00887]
MVLNEHDGHWGAFACLPKLAVAPTSGGAAGDLAGELERGQRL